MTIIIITSNTEAEKTIVLQDDISTIGRADTNNICLKDRLSSRNHAQIILIDKKYYLKDVGSANGTFFNNQKIKTGEKYLLHDNDQIIIGKSKLTITDLPKPVKKSNPPQLMPYSNDGMLIDVNDYELSATLDASVSLAQISADDSSNTENMQKALKRLEAMCTVSEVIGNIMNLNELLTKVLDTVFGMFPKACRVFILLKKNSHFVPAAARERKESTLNLAELKVSQTVLNTCVNEKCSLLSNNTAEDDRFNEAMSINQLEISSFACSPLIVNDEVLGIMQIEGGKESEEFNETDLQMLTGISGQVAIAVKNIKLAAAIEKESAQRANLQRYFSPNMVEMMLSGDVNTKLGGKLYNGTVFFSDIIGFTSMSETMSAEKVVSNLNRYFTVMQGIIYKNRGNVDKFGGDAIMAFWSVPQHKTKDELLAVLTGIQMQGELWPFNFELKKENLKTIYMGIGVNTGDFVAGNIGSEDKIEFTLIGDNVNLTARIEARAGKTQVLCSNKTYLKIKDDVTAVELPPAKFKGKSTPEITYSIRGAKIDNPDLTAMATNIPLRLEDNIRHNTDDFFMLIKIFGNADNKHVVIAADAEWHTGQEHTFNCQLIEYHEKLIFTGAIEQIEKITTNQGYSYNLYTLNNIEGDRFLEIFSLGYKYTTELPWEKMGRDRKVEGK